MKLTHIINGKEMKVYNNIKNNCKKKSKKYEFFLDNIQNCIYITDRLIFIRENDDYYFELEISDNSKCMINLKKEDLSLDLNVINAKYEENDNYIIFYYKLDSDEDEHQIKLEIGD